MRESWRRRPARTEENSAFWTEVGSLGGSGGRIEFSMEAYSIGCRTSLPEAYSLNWVKLHHATIEWKNKPIHEQLEAVIVLNLRERLSTVCGQVGRSVKQEVHEAKSKSLTSIAQRP